MNIRQIKSTVKQACKQRDPVLLTRIGGTTKTERYVILVTEDSFVHTDAVGKNVATVTTPFNDVMTISLIEGDYSTLSNFKKPFNFEKLEKILNPVEEKEKTETYVKAKFLCGKNVLGKPGRRKKVLK